MCEHSDNPEETTAEMMELVSQIPPCQALKVAISLISGMVNSLAIGPDGKINTSMVKVLSEHLASLFAQAMLIDGNPVAGIILLRAASHALGLSSAVHCNSSPEEIETQIEREKNLLVPATTKEVEEFIRDLIENGFPPHFLNPATLERYGIKITAPPEAPGEKISPEQARELADLFRLPPPEPAAG